MLRGRFSGGIDSALLEYSSSLETDREMFSEDVWGSKAHVLMLARQQIIPKEDAGRILKALSDVEKDYLCGRFCLDENLEDIHLNIENYVIEKCGIDYGGRMHTARSRNDQVLTDVKLHMRAELIEVAGLIIDLENTLLSLAEDNTATLMPGYTHMQHAQPITFGYWASSYASMLQRDIDRLNAAYMHVNTCPLGSGALSGTSFPTDREYVSWLLGFDSVHVHALDAVSSRDHIIETLSALSILMCNLSKLAEELVIWSTSEFGFIEFSDGFATGSSIMPQKKNPDMAELVRGKTGRVYGALFQALTLMKGLPSGYNRDMQEDREYLWDALSIAKGSLKILASGLSDAKINKERMKESVLSDYSTATELANYLVREKGLAFRRAYEITGRIVKQLCSEKKDFRDTQRVTQILRKAGLEVSPDALYSILDLHQLLPEQEPRRDVSGRS